jgi:hypothetical protein
MSVIDDLARTPDELEAVLKGFPPERLRWMPPDWNECPAEQFSALGHVCHLRDIEIDGYHVRVERVIREETPDLVSIDGFELARRRRYHEDDVERALAQFREARAETIRRVRAWHPDDAARPATFGELGRITAGGLLHLLRSHDLQHMAGLYWLIARW